MTAADNRIRRCRGRTTGIPETGKGRRLVCRRHQAEVPCPYTEQVNWRSKSRNKRPIEGTANSNLSTNQEAGGPRLIWTPG